MKKAIKIALILSLLALLAAPVMAQQKAKWEIWAQAGGVNMMTADGEMVARVTSAHPQFTYDPKIFHANLPFEDGKTYRVTFDAKSSTPRKILVKVGLQLNEAPWYVDYSGKEVEGEAINLSRGMKTYSFDFTCDKQGTGYETGDLIFELGAGATTALTLDNISVVDLAAGDAAEIFIVNGDFSGPGYVEEVTVDKNENGFRLLVDGEPYGVKGVVWSFTPIGQNFAYNLWGQPDEFIQKVIDADARLMKEMGVNTIRVFSIVPPKWVEYMYNKYGIRTIVNYMMYRYGAVIDGKWSPQTDYSNPKLRAMAKAEAAEVVRTFKDVPGVLMFIFGNESNYGLEWSSSEIEDLPVGEQQKAKAVHLYSLFEEVLAEAKEIDGKHPVGLCNGDLQYKDMIKELVPSLDILGVNIYRGKTNGDKFYSDALMLDVPIVLTEMGADAYNVVAAAEDQYNQADYLWSQWKEIYENSYGKGKAQNCVGAFIFEWMDEWWKHGQTHNLSVHDTVGTWTNPGYTFDIAPGMGLNNMNEEWFGVVGQSTKKVNGVNKRLPRAAYYMFKDVWQIPLYESTMDEIQAGFDKANPLLYVALGQNNAPASEGSGDIFTMNSITLDLMYSETFTGGDLETQQELIADTTDDDSILPLSSLSPLQPLEAVDKEELTLVMGFQPLENLQANATIKIRGNTSEDLLEKIDATTPTALEYTEKIYDSNFDGDPIANQDTVQLYSGAFEYTGDAFDLFGYYHTGVSLPGMADWVMEGDYFNIKPESFDMYGMDMNGSRAPYGVLFTGHQLLEGFKLMAGPEVYYGARPQVVAKYNKNIYFTGGRFGFAVMGQQELDTKEDEDATNDKLSQSLSLATYVDYGPVNFSLGGYFAGLDKLGDTYTIPGSSSTEDITVLDTLAGKTDVAVNVLDLFTVFGRYTYAGLVADYNAAIPRGRFKDDSGSGNRSEINAGIRGYYGNFSYSGLFRQIDPLVGPNDRVEKVQTTGAMANPFFVYDNRQTTEAEIMLAYDPTGATWFHEWNSFDIEDAKLAGSIAALYSLTKGETDIKSYLASDQINNYAFAEPLSAMNGLFTVKVRLISNPLSFLKVDVQYFLESDQILGYGDREADVPDEISTNGVYTYHGGSLKAIIGQLRLDGSLVFNGFGPETWIREWGYTFPLQWNVDLAWAFDQPKFFSTCSRVGIFARALSIGDNSPGELGNGTDLTDKDYLMEVGIYSSISY